MNENEIVTGTEIPAESVTAAPISEENFVSNESAVSDTADMTEEVRILKVQKLLFHFPKILMQKHSYRVLQRRVFRKL